jgi:hypothetical protein
LTCNTNDENATAQAAIQHHSSGSGSAVLWYFVGKHMANSSSDNMYNHLKNPEFSNTYKAEMAKSGKMCDSHLKGPLKTKNAEKVKTNHSRAKSCSS